MEESKLFHESWYRIAGQRICLRESVKVNRQFFHGQRWYVLHDPFSNQFFRLKPQAYQFVARLTLDRTVDEVWKEVISQDPDNSPGQEEVIHLLAQLYHANLLHYTLPADSASLFDRYKKTQQKIVRQTLSNIMFARIPLLDPGAFLKRILPVLRVIISPVSLVIWLAVIVIGAKTAIENFALLSEQSQGILAPANIPILYLCFVFIKVIHEFGHAFAVQRFGGEVHTMGIMFLIFSPIPYVDATAAWSFRSKWKRVFVGAAGMVFELFVAAIALFVWAATGEGAVHSIAYNVIFVASVSTILFNINPLLRFDGYYILSDLLNIPNLNTQSMQHLRHIVERYAFGCKKSKSPAATMKMAVLLTLFGILSGVYRIFVFSAILLFIADRFLIIGIIMALVCAISWIFVPLVRFIRYLATEPRIERTRFRAVSVSLSFLLFAIILLYLVPFPNTFTSPGICEAREYVKVANKAPGYVERIVARSGKQVAAGETLLELRNDALDFRIRELEANIIEVKAMRQKAMIESLADINPIESLLSAISERQGRLVEEKNNCIVKAEASGVWVAPDVLDYVGMWIQRGTPVGQIVNESAFDFSSVVTQTDISRFFSGEILESKIRLSGQAGTTLLADRLSIIPVEQTTLPSAALGFAAGGELPVDVQDKSGVASTEPFYEVRLGIKKSDSVRILHGRTGFAQFTLPAEPLLQQWWRKLIQLIQKRYQI